MPDNIPAADSVFGADSAVPAADSVFGKDSGSSIPNSGSYSDLLFSSSGLKSVFSVAKAFGQSAEEGWGAGAQGAQKFQEGTENELKEKGIFNDYTQGKTSLLKSANEAWIRPAIAGISSLAKPAGALLGGIQGATEQAGENLISYAKQKQKDLGTGVVGEIASPLVSSTGWAGEFLSGLASGYLPEASAHLPDVLTEGRANASIGEDQGQYFGTKEPTQEQALARAQATGNLPQEPITGTPPDIHSVARQIAPDTFQEYDNLTANKEVLRNTLQGLSESREPNPEVADLQANVDKLSALEDKGKITGAQQDRLDQARKALEVTPKFTDTPEMAQVRQDLLKTDFQIRDLSPDVSAAYRMAQEHLGTDAVEAPEEPQTASAEPQEAQEQPSEGVSTETPQEPASEAPKSSQETSSIAQDSQDKLTKAGRPLDEAQAAGKLIEAHYEARAARFQGKLGTAKELYDKESPDIQDAGNASKKKGSLTVNEAKNTIKLFNSADVSTFLHETGHQFLEELVQDSKHEQAPEELKSDAKTVRSWLKNDGSEITRKQHEQFARGFERYLLEGRAPTQDLAGIFQQFKDWLSKIYKSVTDLKSPINNDIRDVYDRLISSDNKTVIGEDPQGSPGAMSSTSDNIKSEPQPNQVNGNERQPAPGVTLNQTFVDKAGNVDLTNITSDGDLRQAIREVIEHYSDDEFLKARRGVQSTQDMLDLADSLAENPKRVDQALRTVSGQFTGTPLSSLTFAIKKLMLQAANDIKEAVAVDDAEKFVEASERLTRFTETFSGATAEWGRMGQMLKDINPEMEESEALAEYLKERTGKTFNQIKSEMKAVGKLDSANKITGFIRDANKPSYGQMLTEVFKNWLISGPITHAAYTIGTELFSIYKAVPERLIESLVSKTHDAISGEIPGKQIFASEALEGAYGLVSGHIEGIKAAWDSFKAGQTTLLPGEERSSTVMTNTKAVPGVLGSIVRAPGERMVAPLHSFNRTVGFFVERNSLIARKALSEGLTGDLLKNRIAELQNQVPINITMASRAAATEGALMGRPGTWTRKAVAFLHHEVDLPLLGKTSPGSFIAPFITVSSNINRLALLERTPLGLASKIIRDDLSGKNGRLAQDTAIGKMALGTSFGIGIGSLYINKQINSAAPSDYKHAVVEQMTTGLPYGARIGDMSYDISRLGVLGTNIAMAVDMAAFGQGVYHAKGAHDYADAAVGLIHSVSSHFLDEGYISGISDVMKAITESDRYGDSWVRNFISTLVVPYSVGSTQVAQRIDPYQRDVRSITDAIKARIPFESETLSPRIDVFGQPLPNKEDWGVYATKISDDPAWLALKDKGYFPAPVKRDINGIPLSDSQYEDYARKSGVLFKMLLTKTISHPGFDNLSAMTIHNMIKSDLTAARAQAEASVKAESVHENPKDNLVTKATAAKRALVKGPIN